MEGKEKGERGKAGGKESLGRGKKGGKGKGWDKSPAWSWTLAALLCERETVL